MPTLPRKTKKIKEIQPPPSHVDPELPVPNKEPLSPRPMTAVLGSKNKPLSIDFFSILQYQEYIAGLAVTEDSLVYTLYQSAPEGAVSRAFGEKSLPAGIIVDGMLRDEEQYAIALKELFNTISGTHTSSVILSIPPQHIWMATLEFPRTLDKRSLTEAIDLYFEFSLPFPKEESYVDWEIIDNDTSSSIQRAVLGAVRKQHIDPYREVLKKEGITAIAIESHLMSVAHYMDNGCTLFVIVYPSGAHLGAYADTVFRFQRFVSWKHIRQRKENEESPVSALYDEIRNIIHFLRTETHAPFETQNIILVAPQDFQNSFAEFVARDPMIDFLKNKDDEIRDPAQTIARGAAMRGLLPRKDDTIMSFTLIGTEKIYEWKRALSFSAFLEKLAIGLSVFFVLLYTGSLVLVKTLATRAESRQVAQGVISQDSINVQDEAERFNKTVEELSALAKRPSRWEKLFEHIARLTNPGITITSLSADDSSSIKLTGVAANRDALIQFKASINSSHIFQDIELPFTLLITKENLPFRFSLTFRDNTFLLTP